MKKLLSTLLIICMTFGAVFAISGCSTVATTQPVQTSANIATALSQDLPSTSAVAPSLPQASPTETEPPVQNTAETSQQGLLKVHYLDVGQADAIFIELPNNQTMLIDAGNTENGWQIMSYIKKNLNHSKIDYIIASHAHADHIGGMSEVINSFDIGSVYMPKVPTNTDTFENLLTAINTKGLSINSAKMGVSILNSQNLKIDIIAPDKTDYDDLNDASAVIKLEYGTTSFLFMGDAEDLPSNQFTSNINIDILKVGHHGSSGLTEDFLERTTPNAAIISVGKDNDYNHPAQDTIDKLNQSNIPIYRTDTNGTIICMSDGKNITFINSPTPAVATGQPIPSSATLPEEKPSATTDPQSITVYVTKTGEKYHLEGCSSLSHSKIAMSLSDAITEEYTPCKKCNPPTN